MELQILDMIQQIRTDFLDTLMVCITRIGDKGIIWIALALLLLAIPKTRKAGIILCFSLAIDLIVCNCILKPLTARIRPFDINTSVELLIGKPTDYSFPSGHTAASFASAAALLLAGRKVLGYISIGLGSLIAFSRMYLYVHYPTDILGGIIVGILCGIAGAMVFQVIYRKYTEKRLIQ